MGPWKLRVKFHRNKAFYNNSYKGLQKFLFQGHPRNPIPLIILASKVSDEKNKLFYFSYGAFLFCCGF